MTPRPDTGQAPEFIEAVFTCQGDFYDPNFPRELELFNQKLQTLLNADNDHLVIKKVEPWNSVKVTVNIPREAAARLKSLASQNNGAALRNMGIISLQMEGDRIISLTLSNPSALGSSSSNGAPPSLPSTSAATAGRGIEDAIIGGSTAHNLFHHPSSSSSLTVSEASSKGPMLPPSDIVPPITISRPRAEKRRRPPASRAPGNKSKANKSKGAQSSGTSSTDNKNAFTPSPNMEISLPSDIARVSVVTTNTDTVDAMSHATPALDLHVIHPALKDTDLTSLPKSTDLADKDSKVNTLLSSLIKQSLDKKLPSQNSAESPLPLSYKPPSGPETPTPSSTGETTAKSVISATTPASNQQHHISENSGSVPLPSPAASHSVCTSAVTQRSLMKSPPRSEHVSVIAKLLVRENPSGAQADAMEMGECGPVNEGERVDTRDLPMDLSTSITGSTGLLYNVNIDSLSNDFPYMKEPLPSHTSVTSLQPDKPSGLSVTAIADSHTECYSNINAMDESDPVETATNTHTHSSPNSCKASTVIESKVAEEDTNSKAFVLAQPALAESSHVQQDCNAEHSDDRGSKMLVTSAESHTVSDTEPTHSEIVNGLEAQIDGAGLAETCDIVYGEPVSVICSTNEDTGRSIISKESDSTAIDADEVPSPTSARTIDVESQHSLATYSVHDPVKQNSHEELLVPNESTAYHVADPGLTRNIIGYNEHTPQYIPTVEHEPAENGSSTSTDSGVVAGSPKSDICATPPTDEEQHLVKPELPTSQSNNQVLDQRPAVTEASETVEQAASPVKNALTMAETSVSSVETTVAAIEPTADAINTTHTTPAVISTYDTVSIPPSANRPCVSILKTVRHVSTNNIINESNHTKIGKPVTTKVIESELRSTPSTHALKIHQQRAQPDGSISYLINSQGSMSNVLLAAANAASANQPYSIGSSSSREHTVVQIPTASTPNVMTNVRYAAPSNNKTRGPTTLLLTNRNDQLVLVDNHYGIEQPLPSMTRNQHMEKGIKSGFILSNENKIVTSNYSNAGGNSNKYQIVASHSAEAKHSHAVIMNLSQAKQSSSRNSTVPSTPVSIVVSSNPSKQLTSTANQRLLASGVQSTMHLPIHQIVNTRPPTLNSNFHSWSEPPLRTAHNPPVDLPGVRVVKPAISVSSKPVSDENSVIKSNSVHLISDTKPSNTDKPFTEGCKAASDSRISPTDYTQPVTDSSGDGNNHSGEGNSQTSHAFESTAVSSVIVNGTIENASSAGHDSETFTPVSNAGSISPLSVTSSCAGLEVQVITSEAATPNPALYSPSQQRKSGRVRTIKSPDPDYVTPTTKVRKRGPPRQISEDSIPTDTAPPAKKVTKPVANKTVSLESAAPATTELVADLISAAQTNGPTSQAKRSTRSSGIADLQALPTVYRERKRSKR